MRITRTALMGAATGVLSASVLLAVTAPVAGAYPGYGGCRNGYEPAGRFAEYGVQDVCALPSVIDYRGFVNPVSARVPEPPPEQSLPDYAQLSSDFPPCFGYDPRTFDGPCAPPWVRVGY